MEKACCAAGLMLGILSASVVHAADLTEFTGPWRISGSAVAPWKEPMNPLGANDDPRFIGSVVTFSSTAVKGPSPIGCEKPVYKVETVGPDMIFEGQLAEPKPGLKAPDPLAAATQLGFADPRHIVTLDAGCTEVQFHLVKPGTLVFGLNNRVYTMTRK